MVKTDRTRARIAEKKYREKHRDRRNAMARKRYILNKEAELARHKEYRIKNRNTINEKATQRYRENKCRINARRRDRHKNEPGYAMKVRLRRRMNIAVKAAGLDKKHASSMELLGIDTKGLAEWLECQFVDGMSWENRSEWHIDHRIPCNAFDLTDPQQQRICFWYRNLQPLWRFDNLSKSDNYNEEDKQALIDNYKMSLSS